MAAIDPFLSRTHIAYFSMEIAVRPEMHSYAGGLGILAGDTARSCAELELPLVFVTSISRTEYFRQEIDAEGRQVEHPDRWSRIAGAPRCTRWLLWRSRISCARSVSTFTPTI